MKQLEGLLIVWLVSNVGSKAIPGVEEFPLTDLDIQLARTATVPAISIKDGSNQTCLLTQRYGPATSSGCTWRISRRCSKKPVVTKIPEYDAGCLADEKDIHSRDCKVDNNYMCSAISKLQQLCYRPNNIKTIAK